MSSKAQQAQLNSFRAFISSLCTSSAVFFLSLAIFVWLARSRKFTALITPRHFAFDDLLHGTLEARPLWRIFTPFRSGSNFAQLRDGGIEVTLFLRFLRLIRNIFGCASLIVTPSLAAFNYLLGGVGGGEDLLNRLTWSNIRAGDNRAYWLYTAYDAMFLTFFIWMMSRELETAHALKHGWLHSDRADVRHHLVSFQGVPPNLRTESDVRDRFQAWNGSITNVQICTIASDKRQESRQLLNRLLRVAERRETEFQRSQVLNVARQGHRNHRFDAAMIKRYGNGSLASRLISSILPLPWQFMLCPLPTLYSRIQTLAQEPASTASTTSTDQPTRILLSLDSREVAESMQHLSLTKHVDQLRGVYVGSADNLISSAQTWATMRSQHLTANAAVVVLILLWTVPISACGSLSQLTGLLALLGHHDLLGDSLRGVALVQGIVPQILTTALMAAFPYLLRIILERWSQPPTKLALELYVQSYYFWFLFSELFITTSVASGLIPVLLAVVKGGLDDLVVVLAENLPLASNYYLSFMMIQGISMAATTLCQPYQYLRYFLSSSNRMSPRDQLQWRSGLLYKVKWGELYPLYSCLAVITIIYSLLNPLILVIATATFTITRACLHYRLFYASDVRNDSDGAAFFRAIFQLWSGCHIMQLTLLGLFTLKARRDSLWQDVIQLLLLAIILVGTIQAERYLRSKYNHELQGLGSYSVITSAHKDIFPTDDTSTDSPEVWLPRDTAGIGFRMKDMIEGFLKDSREVVKIRMEGAYMNSQGEISIDTRVPMSPQVLH